MFVVLAVACSSTRRVTTKLDGGGGGAGGTHATAGSGGTGGHGMTMTTTPKTDAGSKPKTDAGSQGKADAGNKNTGASDSGSATPDTGTPDTGTGTDDGSEGDPCSTLTNLCVNEGTSCTNNTLVSCAPNADGCLVRTMTDCTQGGTNVCDDSSSPAKCAIDPCVGLSNSCNTASTMCQGTTLVTCAQNQDGCLVTTRTDCTMVQGKNTCSGTAPAACNFDKCLDAHGQPKADICVTNQTQCAQDILIECVADADGCEISHRTDCTTAPNENFCNASVDPPKCDKDPCKGVTNCLQGGKKCNATEIVTCAADSNGCLVQSVQDCTAGGTVHDTCDSTSGTPTCVGCTDDPACSGKAEGAKACDSNVAVTCSDTDGDGCLEALRETCGSSFTCDASNGCVYSGNATCDKAATAVLRHPGTYPGFTTTGGMNTFSNYTCPGLGFPVAGAAPDELFAVDVAPKTVVSVTLTGATGFTGNGAELLLLTACANAGNTTAEATCSTLSTTSVKYTNDSNGDVRVYVVVDAEGMTNVGSFGLIVDTHAYVCGDGKLDGTEQCDDGNIVSGDGCTPSCTLESGFQCTNNSPSVCTKRPSNGVCGNVMCSALPAGTPAGAVVCCTPQQTCGVAYQPVYGAACIERDQPGRNTTACPSEQSVFAPLFPSLTGCCRTDNTCGLTAASGAGCVSRTETWLDLQDGLGAVLYSGPFEPIACTY